MKIFFRHAFLTLIAFFLIIPSAEAAMRSFDLAFEKVTSQHRPAAKHYKISMTVLNKSSQDMELSDQICYHANIDTTSDSFSGCIPGLHSYQRKMRVFFMIPEAQKGKTFAIQLDTPKGYEDPNGGNNLASVTVGQ